jgi:hypothetical protein
VDKVSDSTGCDNYSCRWLKGVGVAFLLEEGLIESSSSYYKRLEADIMAIAVVGIEVDSIDYRRGKQGSSGIFPTVVALIYAGV